MPVDANGVPLIGSGAESAVVPDGKTEESVTGAAVPAGSGEIDPPTDQAEEDFVDSAWDALENGFIPDKDIPDPEPQGQEPAAVEAGKEEQQPAATQTPEAVVPPKQEAAPLTPEQAVQQVAQPPQAPAQAATAEQSGQQPAQQAVGPNPAALQTLQQEVEKVRDQFVKENSEALYKTFSDEEKETLGEDQAKLLAQMGARLHHDIVSNVLGMVSAKAPEMVLGLLHAQRENQAKEEEFFGEYPHLKAHKDQLTKLAPLVAQQWPEAKGAEFKKKLAQSAAVFLGITPTGAPPTRPTQPAARPPAFQPAAGRGPGAAPQAPTRLPPGATDWGSYDEIIQAEQEGRLSNLG